MTSLDPRLQTSVVRIEENLLGLEEFSYHFSDSKVSGGLTIFIPNWNHKAFLPRSLLSAIDALRQLRKNGFAAEILVIDDGSRDGSQKLLRSVQAYYGNLNLRTISLNRNLGLTRLRNLALLSSKYRYVCMLDADNELIAKNVPLFVRSIVETNAAMVFGNLIVKNGQNVSTIVSDIKLTWFITERNYIDALTIVDAERLLEIGGYARLHPYLADDWEMNAHLVAEEEDVVFVPAVLAYYHQLPLSAVTENIPNRTAAQGALSRVYTQTGTRGWDREQVGRMYHPDFGFID